MSYSRPTGDLGHFLLRLQPFFPCIKFCLWLIYLNDMFTFQRMALWRALSLLNAIEKFTLNNRFDDQRVKLRRLKTNRELDERIFQCSGLRSRELSKPIQGDETDDEST